MLFLRGCGINLIIYIKLINKIQFFYLFQKDNKKNIFYLFQKDNIVFVDILISNSSFILILAIFGSLLTLSLKDIIYSINSSLYFIFFF